jgi:hypothetical protein
MSDNSGLAANADPIRYSAACQPTKHMNLYTVKNGHSRPFSSELFLILLLKIPNVSTILRNSS